jgi:hypothetical protein
MDGIVLMTPIIVITGLHEFENVRRFIRLFVKSILMSLLLSMLLPVLVPLFVLVTPALCLRPYHSSNPL